MGGRSGRLEASGTPGSRIFIGVWICFCLWWWGGVGAGFLFLTMTFWFDILVHGPKCGLWTHQGLLNTPQLSKINVLI